MTRKEFSSKSEALSRIEAWLTLVGMISIFAGMIARGLLQYYIQRHYHTNRFDAAGDILLLIMAVGGLSAMTCFGPYLARKWRMVCPTCGKNLVEKSMRIALLTGKCPKCEKEVFSDHANPESISGKTYRLSQEEFKLQFETINRRAIRREVGLLVVFLALFFSCIPLTKYFQDLVKNGKFDWVTPTQWVWITATMLGLLLLSFLSVLVLRALGKIKTPGVPCSECGRPLFAGAGRAAINTGLCIYCGEKLFEVTPIAKT